MGSQKNKDHERTPVHKDRMGKARNKFENIKQLATKLLQGSTLLGLCGAEHFCIEDKEVNVLQKQAADCGSIKPFAVPTILRLLCQGISRDPKFIARAAQICRWAREIWMATDKYGGPTHEDCLNGKELHCAITYMNNEDKTGNIHKGQ